jgi:protein-disulfide isomerase
MSFRDDKDALYAEVEALKHDLSATKLEAAQKEAALNAELEKERRRYKELKEEKRKARPPFTLAPAHRKALGVLMGLVGCALVAWLVYSRRPDTPPAVVPVPATEKGPWLAAPTSGQTIGEANAPIQIELFSDLQCPFCEATHNVLMQLVQGHPGKIHIRMHDYPLESHQAARFAALWARCAAEQGRYWPYLDKLFKNHRSLDAENLKAYGREVGLEPKQLEACAASTETAKALEQDIELGRSRGVKGVPAYFVNGEMLTGQRSLHAWEEIVKAKLEALGRGAEAQ